MKKRIIIDAPTAVALKIILRKTTFGQMMRLHLESDEIQMVCDLLEKLEEET